MVIEYGAASPAPIDERCTYETFYGKEDVVVHRDIIVIGASAGGVETLPKLFQHIPQNAPAAFFVVLHVHSHSPSLLPSILSREGRLPAVHPVDGEELSHGTVYVAPPDYHMYLEGNRIRLSHGPKENRHRPAIDPLFRTAAKTFGQRVIGIVLTGSLSDGSAGLAEIKHQKGVTIVQEPTDALYPEMPRNALGAVVPDFCVPVREMPALLGKLISEGVRVARVKRAKDKLTKPESKHPKSLKTTLEEMGPPSGFMCPECNGPLWEIRNGKSMLYRCFVGHSYALETLVEAQNEELERSLWAALRALEERVELQCKLAERASVQQQHLSSKQFMRKARENAEHARLIRGVLEKL